MDVATIDLANQKGTGGTAVGVSVGVLLLLLLVALAVHKHQSSAHQRFEVPVISAVLAGNAVGSPDDIDNPNSICNSNSNSNSNRNGRSASVGGDLAAPSVYGVPLTSAPIASGRNAAPNHASNALSTSSSTMYENSSALLYVSPVYIGSNGNDGPLPSHESYSGYAVRNMKSPATAGTSSIIYAVPMEDAKDGVGAWMPDEFEAPLYVVDGGGSGIYETTDEDDAIKNSGGQQLHVPADSALYAVPYEGGEGGGTYGGAGGLPAARIRTQSFC